MSGKSNEKKAAQLGMPYGTANARLRKNILFDLLRKHNENFCFQCGGEIESCDNLSIEHKKPWIGNDTALFWDLDNIAFSHLSCNVSAARRPLKGTLKHPSAQAYKQGCRCAECTEIQRVRAVRYRATMRKE